MPRYCAEQDLKKGDRPADLANFQGWIKRYLRVAVRTETEQLALCASCMPYWTNRQRRPDA